ncbi:hypothetical protein VHUM_01714 [Vanrija humicola]|uniref:Uncharacterized protein n=1 Tax=Vanrija humicola TaxID=5417 RepID=A0A7D8Z6T5_VANHU|nr:hypothetical protein VHUM_01714 [Vanrija humicola]
MSLHILAREEHARDSPYGYVPTLTTTVPFIAVFGLLTAIHLGLGIRYRYWSALGTMVAGGLLEVIGWAGRVWSSQNPTLFDPFIMQTTCLIIGPVFFSAWDYTMLGACIARMGPQFSVLGAKWYLMVFIVADIVSLVLQAMGGGGASVAAQNGTDTAKSTNIMVAGILFQLGATSIFAVLAADFMYRVIFNKPYAYRERAIAKAHAKAAAKAAGAGDSSDTAIELNHAAYIPAESVMSDSSPKSTTPLGEAAGHSADLRGTKLLLAGVAFATLMIVIRGIYRAIELLQGWSGYIITHEVGCAWPLAVPSEHSR